MKLRRTFIPLAAALLASGPALSQQTAVDPAVAVLGGMMFPDVRGADDDFIYGLELSWNCHILRPAQARVRHQVSVTRYDDSPLRMTSAELNSHYTIDLTPDLALGFGPGIGYARTDIGDDDHGLWAFQLGAHLHYRLPGNLFLGGEARYQFTESARFEGRNQDADNMRILGKIGIHF